MKEIYRWSGALLVALVMANTVMAQDRIAVVNFRKLVMSHPKAIALEAELRKYSQQANRSLQEKEKQLAAIEANMKQVKKDGTLQDGTIRRESAAVLVDMRQKALEIQEAAVTIRANATQSIQSRRAQELPSIAAAVSELVATANHGRFTVVLDSSALSPEGFPQVVEYSGAADLTPMVLALMPNE